MVGGINDFFVTNFGLFRECFWGKTFKNQGFLQKIKIKTVR
jgi:hypothetical protein